MMKRFHVPARLREGSGKGSAQAGQAYAEYGLILILIGITVIGALTIMGQQVHAMWHTISAAMPR